MKVLIIITSNLVPPFPLLDSFFEYDKDWDKILIRKTLKEFPNLFDLLEEIGKNGYKLNSPLQVMNNWDGYSYAIIGEIGAR